MLVNVKNEISVVELDKCDTKDRISTKDYKELKNKLKQSMLELERARVKSYLSELKGFECKEKISHSDYNRIFKLRRRIAKTEAFKMQYVDWFMNNLELGVAIYQAGCDNEDELNPIVTFGESMPKGMYVNFENNFLRVMKKSDFYNDYGYAIKSKNSRSSYKVLFRDVIVTLKNFIEECNGELSFNFEYDGVVVEYPLFQKENWVKNGPDTLFCTLAVNEEIVDLLINAINENVKVISNIHTIDVHDDVMVYANVVDFNFKNE